MKKAIIIGSAVVTAVNTILKSQRKELNKRKVRFDICLYRTAKSSRKSPNQQRI